MDTIYDKSGGIDTWVYHYFANDGVVGASKKPTKIQIRIRPFPVGGELVRIEVHAEGSGAVPAFFSAPISLSSLLSSATEPYHLQMVNARIEGVFEGVRNTAGAVALKVWHPNLNPEFWENFVGTAEA